MENVPGRYFWYQVPFKEGVRMYRGEVGISWGGYVWGRVFSRGEYPSPIQKPPWTATTQDRDPLWTETSSRQRPPLGRDPLDRTPPPQINPLGKRHLLDRDLPQTETPKWTPLNRDPWQRAPEQRLSWTETQSPPMDRDLPWKRPQTDPFSRQRPTPKTPAWTETPQTDCLA